MNAFLQALLNPSYSFLRNALAAALLSSVLFGVLGSIVTVKRIAGLAGAISHAVLGGIGMALYLKAVKILPSITPMAGALLFALIAALIIALVSLKAKQREDTVINAVWAIGMSVGVLFMAKTPGYTDPSSYLFGNILLVSSKDLILLAVLDVLVIILSWRFYPQLIASSFDEEFSRVRGVKTQLVFIIILVITAVSVCTFTNLRRHCYGHSYVNSAFGNCFFYLKKRSCHDDKRMHICGCFFCHRSCSQLECGSAVRGCHCCVCRPCLYRFCSW